MGLLIFKKLHQAKASEDGFGELGRSGFFFAAKSAQDFVDENAFVFEKANDDALVGLATKKGKLVEERARFIVHFNLVDREPARRFFTNEEADAVRVFQVNEERVLIF